MITKVAQDWHSEQHIDKISKTKSTYMEKTFSNWIKTSKKWHKINMWSTNWWSWCNRPECKSLSQTCLTRHDMQQLGEDDKKCNLQKSINVEWCQNVHNHICIQYHFVMYVTLSIRTQRLQTTKWHVLLSSLQSWILFSVNWKFWHFGSLWLGMKLRWLQTFNKQKE